MYTYTVHDVYVYIIKHCSTLPSVQNFSIFYFSFRSMKLEFLSDSYQIDTLILDTVTYTDTLLPAAPAYHIR